ncbi:hypothetical protein CDG76_33655 [Nostoc sp. 'Peltigera membranacea cyanobiont' 210A]|uniref:hypothetical protein n=1 Tax=Nostoc sp. 'Peltigera membranacea cyanobiont' 210A TaxID=2014529 RepID=UPI000B95B4BE|nr:hypothetical protein [Nostoc sp. 'Peltigera membranacea cyanobiont' 210A]OYD89757.1 hypothetical protein CDG76_33655 [Nostoc sp. 'Peltigera membranacea cyanobiont' 210A]
MNNSKVRIPKEIAPDVFALAAQLYAQENQDYCLEEIMQAGAEVQIPPEVIQQAIQQIQAKQIRDRDRQRSLKLILTQYSSVKHFFLLSVSSAPLWFVKKIDFDKEF